MPKRGITNAANHGKKRRRAQLISPIDQGKADPFTPGSEPRLELPGADPADSGVTAHLNIGVEEPGQDTNDARLLAEVPPHWSGRST